MPQQTKIFRVFVSSTFTDMKEERRVLQKEVFPALEKYCEENGAKFQAVDLRWGVNEESQLYQQTLEICLNEIKRCQKISPKPNFLILLGDKYGWQPIPAIIPETEMKQIKNVVSKSDLAILDLWYKLDKNAIPAEYVLQPRGIEYKEYTAWKVQEEKLRNILRNSVSRLFLNALERVKYFASATHQEIIRGALNPPPDAERPEEHVFAFVRDISAVPNSKPTSDYEDLIDGEPDQYCATALTELKYELKDKLRDHYVSYQTYWENGNSVLYDQKGFADKVFEVLEKVISQQLSQITFADEIQHEVRIHKEFKERLNEHFRGRENILKKNQSYIENTGVNKPLSLIGDSGSGKSSVMAQSIDRYKKKKPNSVIVYRFIGTTSPSSNVVSLLRSICGQIAKEYNVTLESLAGECKEKTLYELNGLTDVLKNCLALGTSDKPILVFLDALDQLSDTDNSKSFYWLPRELPENARFVVSAISEFENQLSSTEIVHLPLLPKPEAREILSVWFDAIQRTITDNQYEEILDKFSITGLAIYLKLAFERAKQWHSYDEGFTLKSDVKGIINDFIDVLEVAHMKDFVKHALCYMLCGKYNGLTENEILEILVFDKDYWEVFLKNTHEDHRQELIDLKVELEKDKKGTMKIPIVVWSRFFLDMEPYLTERDADGVPIITFFHRQFNEVLRERYQLVEEDIKY